MTKCPECGHTFKDEGRAKGGQKSKREITPGQQEKMQTSRKKKKEGKNESICPEKQQPRR